MIQCRAKCKNIYACLLCVILMSYTCTTVVPCTCARTCLLTRHKTGHNIRVVYSRSRVDHQNVPTSLFCWVSPRSSHDSRFHSNTQWFQSMAFLSLSLPSFEHKSSNTPLCDATRNNLTMMQVQSQRVAVQPVPLINRVAGVQRHPSRLSFSGVSHSFATGTAICARPVRKVTSRCQTQRVHADIFFTQKTVPDQTGRVAIVTGKQR